jgi:hypothetical protein
MHSGANARRLERSRLAKTFAEILPRKATTSLGVNQMDEYRNDNPDFSEVFRGSRARKRPKQKREKPEKPKKPYPTSGFFVEEMIAAMKAQEGMDSGKRDRRRKRVR